MNPRQIVFLLAAILFLVGALLPRPIIEKANSKPLSELWWVRLCLASVGVIMILILKTVR
jgi:protein-S-isoprenylcysteine O-methyltransferase Ste14